MGPAFYVMAILGCGEAEGLCEPVTTAPVRYESAQACEAQTAAMIERHSDILYPVVVAQCRAANETVAEKVWADEVKLPDAQQKPQVRRASYARPSRS